MFVSQAKLAVRNLTRNRTRSLIALTSIAFGVVALLIAGGFIEWIFWAIREAVILNGLGHVQISRPGFRDSGFADPSGYLLPPDETALRTVQAIPQVEVVDQRLLLSGLISSGEISVTFAGEAVDPVADRKIFRVLAPIEGQDLAGADDPRGVLLGRGLAAALGAVKPGDGVSLLVSIPSGGINAVEARVVGLFTTGVKAYDDRAVRIPLALGRELLRVRGSHLWVIGLSDTQRTDETVALLHARLPPDRFAIHSWFELSDFYRKSVVLLSRQIDVIAALICIIIVLGISNTLTMNVLERVGEIGTVMALGTTRGGILRLFVLEGVLLGAIGALCGVIGGYLLAQAISYIGIPMPPPPGRDVGYAAKIILTVPLVLGGFAMAVISTVLASLYPAWKASRLTIVDALRHNR